MLSLDDQLNFEGMLDDSGITSSVNTSSISELTSSSSQPTELSDFGPGMSDVSTSESWNAEQYLQGSTMT